MDTDCARVGLLWTSATGISLGYLSLPSHDSGSILKGLQQRLSFSHSRTTSSSLFLVAFTVAALAYAVASHSIYIRAQKLASRAIFASLGLLVCQMILAPSLMNGTERMLVLLPLSLSVGLSWASCAGHATEGRVQLPEEKS